MDYKHISTMESNSEIASNCIDPKVSDDTINTDFSEKAFDALINNIKTENLSYFKDSESYSQELTDTKLVDAVEPPNAIVDPAPIRRKQSNVIYDIISNKNVKKQRLNKKYSSYENNSTDYNTTKSYRNKNIVHVSPLKLNHKLKKNPYFHNREKSSKKKCVKNVLLDKYITDFDSSSDSKITVRNTNNLLDSEIFSNNDSEEIFPDHEIKETDFLVVASDDSLSLDSNCEFVKSNLEINPDCEIKMVRTFITDSEKSLDGEIVLNGENILDSVKDLNCEIVPDVETESDSDEQSHINISVTEDKFNCKKLSDFKIVSNVQNGSYHEILLDDDKVLEFASGSDKGTIKYKIMFDGEIKSSDNKGSICIIISDNDTEMTNKNFSTYKINVVKGSDSKILLDGENFKIVSESGNREVKYEIKPDNKDFNKCIIIFDDENEFINKKLSTLKIVSDVKERSDFEILLNGDKVYDIESTSDEGKINYMIVSKDEVISSTNKGSQCRIISNKEKKYNYKKSTFHILVKNFQKGSHFEKVYNLKNVSDFKIMPNCIVNDSQLQINCRLPYLEPTVNEDGDTQQDTIQEYFKNIFAAIKYFFENVENDSLKELYYQIGNDADVLRYLMETMRMYQNGELVISKTANEFSRNYLENQKKIINNYFSDPKNSIDASKPFIHPSSHLHQYSKRLSPTIEPLIIKDITAATSTSTRSSTIAPPKNNVALNKCVGSKFNNIRCSKLLPLCSSVESRLIPHLPDDNQTFVTLIIQNQTKIGNIQYPVAIKNKKVSKNKVFITENI